MSNRIKKENCIIFDKYDKKCKMVCDRRSGGLGGFGNQLSAYCVTESSKFEVSGLSLAFLMNKEKTNKETTNTYLYK